MDPNQNDNLGDNPAATVANAAMGGATPVVTTTDLNASDVTSEPTLQAPALDSSALDAPVLDTAELEAAAANESQTTSSESTQEPNGPVTLAPSADFQMDAVSTVSAVQNGADGNLAAQNEGVLVGQPLEAPAQNTVNPMDSIDTSTTNPVSNTTSNVESAPIDGNGPADFGEDEPEQEGEAVTAEKMREEYEYDPLVAAAPVPGSIGSAKSYADIQRAEAEKAAKMSANGGKGMDKKTLIMIIIVAVLAVIGIVVGAIVMLSGNSTPAPKTNPVSYPDEPEYEYSTLSCTRNLVPEEYESYGALSGVQENVFYFKNDELDGLETNFKYDYKDLETTNLWRDRFAADYGVVPNAKKEEKKTKTESKDDEEVELINDDSEDSDKDEIAAETTGKKTTAEMLHHYVNTEDYTVIHGMEVTSEDIADWLASDAYSDVTYGATSNGAAAPVEEGEEEEEEEIYEEDGDVIRNLKYYNRLQNSINYSCSILKG